MYNAKVCDTQSNPTRRALVINLESVGDSRTPVRFHQSLVPSGRALKSAQRTMI